jgi:hypothetical protein
MMRNALVLLYLNSPKRSVMERQKLWENAEFFPIRLLNCGAHFLMKYIAIDK